MPHRVYLAGPDVFLPDAAARAGAMKAICAQHGLTGVSPLDDLPEAPAEWTTLPEAFRIHRRNEAHIRSSVALIANLTPFRGPSADVGTVFELGYMRALGRPIFAYANTAARLLERTRALIPTTEFDGGWIDEAGMSVENFDLFDNLMLDGAIIASGGTLIVEDKGADRWRDLSAFEKCVQQAAKHIRG
jgi:nucleoside 2-deoxyribosyltransferase